MDPAWSVEYRYSTSAKVRDVAYGIAAGAAPGMLGWIPFKDRVEGFGCLHVLASWTFFTMLAVLVQALVRWGRRARFDSRSLEVQGLQLAWEEIEEVFPRPRGGVEVRGAGRRVCLDWSYGAHDFREMVASRCRERLLARALERIRAGGTVAFPGPWTPGGALAAAGTALLFFSSPLVLLFEFANHPRYGNGCAAFAFLWTAALAFAACRVFVWKGGRAEASAEGLRVTALRPGPVHPWSGLLRIDATSGGGATLVFGDRESRSLPPVLANLGLLPGLHAALRR